MDVAPVAFASPSTPDLAPLSGAILTVDVAAVVANWRVLAARAHPAACAAVLKADAYGMGADRLGPALADAGCRHFFVAHLAEGIALRARLGAATVFVLHGPPAGGEAAMAEHDLVPVLNSPDQVAAWAAEARRRGSRLPAALHVDTGMARLGVPSAALDGLDGLAALELRLVMSHLASADRPADPANPAQRAAFAHMRARLPDVPASLAASSGIFLGPAFHFDLVRPGAALFGIAPIAHANPLRQAVRVQARILQVRDVEAGAAVGYGHTWRAAAAARLAVAAIGYADGLPRALSNRFQAWAGPHRLPFAGRVSMDCVTLDVSAAPPDAVAPGTLVDLIGARASVDDMAAAAGTIGYEILTGLGRRIHRLYRDGPA